MLCRFTKMNGIVQDIHKISVTACFCRRLCQHFTSSTWQLISWTVIDLTTTKFKTTVLAEIAVPLSLWEYNSLVDFLRI
jgi:hypothetical protein